MSRKNRVHPRLIALAALLGMTTACASGAADVEVGDPGTSESPSIPIPTSPTPSGGSVTDEPGGDQIVGKFDVGGHSLHLDCTGSGEPTIVYLHGAVWNHGYNPHDRGFTIRDEFDGDNRFCVYDRRNVGLSDKVDAVQHVDDAIGDFRELMSTAGIDPPYVLLGASFGGTLASIYANTYPDEVAGMVLLDSMFGDLLVADAMAPPELRFEASHEQDQAVFERISHYEVLTRAQELIGSEPEIPMTFFASTLEPMEDQGLPEIDAIIPELREELVSRYSPGELIFVESPHFMEPVIPAEIAEALRDVLTKAGF